jgi:hypothetical protein
VNINLGQEWSSQVYKKRGRSSFAIPYLENNSCMKYLYNKLGHITNLKSITN